MWTGEKVAAKVCLGSRRAQMVASVATEQNELPLETSFTASG